MSASETSLSAFRTRFYATAASLTGEPEERPDSEGYVECRGGCIRGLLWALALEGAGVLTIGYVAHVLGYFHG